MASIVRSLHRNQADSFKNFQAIKHPTQSLPASAISPQWLKDVWKEDSCFGSLLFRQKILCWGMCIMSTLSYFLFSRKLSFFRYLIQSASFPFCKSSVTMELGVVIHILRLSSWGITSLLEQVPSRDIPEYLLHALYATHSRKIPRNLAQFFDLIFLSSFTIPLAQFCNSRLHQLAIYCRLSNKASSLPEFSVSAGKLSSHRFLDFYSYRGRYRPMEQRTTFVCFRID